MVFDLPRRPGRNPTGNLLRSLFHQVCRAETTALGRNVGLSTAVIRAFNSVGGGEAVWACPTAPTSRL